MESVSNRAGMLDQTTSSMRPGKARAAVAACVAPDTEGPPCRDEASPTYTRRMAKKRGYSREFTPRTDRRIKREIDRVPPTLDEKVQSKLRRVGISLRALTLQLWKDWAERE